MHRPTYHLDGLDVRMRIKGEVQMLKIYGPTQSRAFRVLWLAHELGIAFEQVPVSINVTQAQCKEPWFLAINPNGRVPAIDDDGFRLWESVAILQYLAKKSGSALYPRTLEDEARMLQWAMFTMLDLEPPMVAVLRNRLVLPPEKRDESAALDGLKNLQRPLAIYEGELVHQPFFAGEQWAMADFMVASAAATLLMLKVDLAAYPKFAAWLKASAARPAARAAGGR